MVRRSSSSWLNAAVGMIAVGTLAVSLCAASPVAATDVVAGGKSSPRPAVVAPEAVTPLAAVTDRPLGSARDVQRPSPALDPITPPDVPAPGPAPATAATTPATASQLAKALAEAPVPASSRVDPLAVLKRFPDGSPLLTYRVCSTSADRAASCTDRLPSGVPALVNVTGDGSDEHPDTTADLLVDALPATGDGLGVLAVRLASSEVLAAAPLRARVWIDYDLPTGARLTAGYDGLDQGAGLSRATLGIFSAIPSGFSVEMRNSGAAGSLGLSVSDESSALSARISPVPTTARVSSSTGPATAVDVDNSASADRIDVTSANRTAGSVRATFTKVPTRADYLLDVPNRRSETTASAALGRVEALARVPVGGRTWSAFTDATTVPSRFTADFGDGELSLQSGSGRVGAAAVAVSNHTAATVPQSPNFFAVHDDATSGDFDAAAAVPSLRDATYSRTADGDRTFAFDTGAAPVALDADAAPGHDLEYFVGGMITAPGTVTVGTSGGQVHYTADRSLGIRLTAAAGKVGALNGLFVPLYAQGVAVRAAGCDGDGCEPDDSVFCSVFENCFAVGANIAIPAAPTRISVDPEAGTTELGAFRPRGALDVYTELDGLVPGIARLRAKTTLGGLPASFGATVGPVGVDPSKTSVAYSATGPVGALQTDADADTAAGTVRSQVVGEKLPKAFAVESSVGAQARVHAENGSSLGRLSLQTTRVGDDGTDSALVRLGDVPATVDLRAAPARTVDGYAAPTLTYSGSAATLDGSVQFSPASGADDYVSFTDLGSRAELSTGVEGVRFVSEPASGALDTGVSMGVPDVDSEQTTSVGSLTVSARARLSAGTAPVGLHAAAVRSLVVRPGDGPFGLPAAVGLLFPAIGGDYGQLDLGLAPAVAGSPTLAMSLAATTQSAGGDTAAIAPTEVDGAIGDTVAYHRYAKGLPSTARASLVPTGCVQLQRSPGAADVTTGSVRLRGRDGDQSIALVDLGGALDDTLVDLLGADASPWSSSVVTSTTTAGRCGR